MTDPLATLIAALDDEYPYDIGEMQPEEIAARLRAAGVTLQPAAPAEGLRERDEATREAFWAEHRCAPAEGLDVERLTAAIERVLQDSDSRIGGPYAPLDSPVISVRFDRPAYAAAIVREYAALTPEDDR